jgi:hypothetical protein
MSAKMVFPSALIVAALSWSAAWAQSTPAVTNGPEAVTPVPSAATDPAQPSGTSGPAGPVSPAGTPGLSQWITYGGRPDCCGPIGGNGPIKDELYLRTGPSLPVAGPIMGHVLETGWEVQGGGRVLFFNPDRDKAWTVDVSISSIWNGGQHDDHLFPMHILASTGAVIAGTGTPEVFHADVVGALRELNRTSVNLGVGREWYLVGNAASCGCGQRSWRVGIDGGVGYGSQSASVAVQTFPGLPGVAADGTLAVINMLRRSTDTFASAFVSLHTDVEFPCGCCVYQFGFRAEWAYTWSDLLQVQNDSDMMDVNLLLTFGVRF